VSSRVNAPRATLSAPISGSVPARTHHLVHSTHELLPYSGNVFPLKQNWEDDRQDQAVTVSFFFLNVFYLGLACAGAWKLWNGNIRTRPALLAIAVYLVLRTLFLTTVEAPEPRYVLVCFPAILALGAAAFIRRPKSVPTPR